MGIAEHIKLGWLLNKSPEQIHQELVDAGKKIPVSFVRDMFVEHTKDTELCNQNCGKS